jgi:hypothetical protein
MKHLTKTSHFGFVLPPLIHGRENTNMAVISALGLLLGATLSQRFRAFCLAPVSLMLGLGMFLGVIIHGLSVTQAMIPAIVLIATLNFGYLFGVLFFLPQANRPRHYLRGSSPQN